MAMGRRGRRQRQKDLWVAAVDMPKTAAHPFYRKLNELPTTTAAFVEGLCGKFYAPTMGRLRWHRGLLIGYFEGTDSEREHRLAHRRFAVAAALPDDRTRRGDTRPLDHLSHPAADRCGKHRRMQLIAKAGLLQGGTATTLEANAALRSCGAPAARADATGHRVRDRDADHVRREV